MKLTREILEKARDAYGKLSELPLGRKLPDLIMYRPSDLKKLGLTLEDVRGMLKEEE